MLRSRMTPLQAGLLGGLCAFVFFAGAMNTLMRGWPAWYRLAEQGQLAEARITGRQPEIHQTCTFEFRVGTDLHTGSDGGCEARVGDTVRITYLPGDPSFATLRLPRGELIGQVVGSVLMSAFAGLVVGVRMRKRGTTA
jgi:hypothetical protein